MCEFSACLHVSAAHVCLVPAEVRRGQHLPWNWSVCLNELVCTLWIQVPAELDSLELEWQVFVSCNVEPNLGPPEELQVF